MCGVISIYSKDAEGIQNDLALGLVAVKHRGPDAAGAVISNLSGYVEARIREEVNDHFLGMVQHMIISPPESGPIDVRAFGHTRYTTDDNAHNPHNAQPKRVGDSGERLKIVFNGNIPGHLGIRREHLTGHASFQTLGDTETLARFMLHKVLCTMTMSSGNIRASITEAVKSVMGTFDGAYAVTGDFKGHTFIYKDPYGIRPLALGKKEGRVIAASENHFFERGGYEKMGEFPNGHLLIIGPDDDLVDGFPEPQNLLTERFPVYPDAFEFVYLAHRDSEMYGVKVGDLRTNLGRYAASELLQHLGGKHSFDMVVSVPNGANDMKTGACEVLGLPSDGPNGLEKVVDVRSFMASNQVKREQLVRMKFLVNEGVVQGKNILLIDDSIVRGTTMKVLVDMLLTAGAKSVHVLSSSPIVYNGDRYGIAMSTSQLVARDISDSRMLSMQEIESLLFSDMSGQKKHNFFSLLLQDFDESFRNTE